MNITDVLALVVFLTTWGVIEVMFWRARAEAMKQATAILLNREQGRK